MIAWYSRARSSLRSAMSCSRSPFDAFFFLFFAMTLLSLPRARAARSRPRSALEASRMAEDVMRVVVEREEGHLAHRQRAHGRVREAEAVEGALAPLAEGAAHRGGRLVEVGQRAL